MHRRLSTRVSSGGSCELVSTAFDLHRNQKSVQNIQIQSTVDIAVIVILIVIVCHNIPAATIFYLLEYGSVLLFVVDDTIL